MCLVVGRNEMEQDDPANYVVWFESGLRKDSPEENILVRCCLSPSLAFGRTARDETVMRPASSLLLRSIARQTSLWCPTTSSIRCPSFLGAGELLNQGTVSLLFSSLPLSFPHGELLNLDASLPWSHFSGIFSDLARA
jgi:hypothetical protein